MIAPWFRPPHVFDKPAQRSDRSFADHCPAPFTHVMQHVGGVHTVPRPAPPAEPAPAGPSRRSGRRVLHLERRTFYRFPVIVRLRARRAPFRTQDHGVRVRIGVNHDPRAGGVPAFYPGHDDVTGFRIRPTDGLRGFRVYNFHYFSLYVHFQKHAFGFILLPVLPIVHKNS